MTSKGLGDFRPRQSQSGRVRYVTALCCLALAAGACSRGLTFSGAQTSFRNFSECAVIEDVLVRRVKLEDAWLQNVVELSQPSSTQPGSPQGTATEAYVVTGVTRAAVADGPRRDDFTVLLVTKALDEYKVVNWATNIGRKQEERKPLPVLLKELHSKPYRGRCSW